MSVQQMGRGAIAWLISIQIVARPRDAEAYPSLASMGEKLDGLDQSQLL